MSADNIQIDDEQFTVDELITAYQDAKQIKEKVKKAYQRRQREQALKPF